jgi:iodothyronine deiodinase-like protein
LHHRFGDRVEFFVIYIREAHPTDGWQVESNERDGVLYQQPMTLAERTEIANVCALRLELSIPTLIDDLDNSTDLKYYALPDRLYLVGRAGRIAYRGAPGPFGFIAAELEQAIERYLAEED